jgi:flagellar basal-body rod modification protein FlgD
MSRVNLPTTSATSNAGQQPAKANTVNELTSNDFLKLLIAELQNQDPTAPTDSIQMLQQVSQIRQITSNDSMIATMNSVQVGQDVATASQLVGKQITALDSNNKEVEGVVSRVTISASSADTGNREIRLHIGDKQVSLNQIRSILPTAA